jgi:hypothetical protein
MKLEIEQIEKAFDAWSESFKVTKEEKADEWHAFLVQLMAVYREGAK